MAQTAIDAAMRLRKQFVEIHYIGISDLIANKKAAGRAKDLDDLKYLRRATHGNRILALGMNPKSRLKLH